MNPCKRFLVICLLTGITGSQGCLARYRTNPVEVTVSHGNNQEPVVGATVRVEYPKRDLLTAPPATHGVTNEEGKITLPIADIKTAMITVSSAKEEKEAAFKESFQLSQELIREGGDLGRANAIQAASLENSSSLQLTLENRKWNPGFLDRFRRQSAARTAEIESESGSLRQ